MAVDYNVVIVGGSPAGRYAAVTASQLGAKVALVEPPQMLRGTATRSPLLDLLQPHTFSHIAQLTQRWENANQFGIHCSNTENTTSNGETSVQWVEAKQWASNVVSNLAEQNSLAVLASLGVDVIIGNGQFERQPSLAFAVNHRRLLARSYLIAAHSLPAIPEIVGLQTTGYHTISTVWQALTAQKPPQRWVIIGGDPDGCQLAQTLVRLGFDVTLIVKRSHILANEDPEIAQLMQATLEAEGVRVLTQTAVTQVKRIEEQKWIQAGDRAIETDEILLCAGQQPNLETLNLEAVGVKWHRHGVQLNAKLQTTNPRIYACGDVISGYSFTNIANYEASVALKNALFFPLFKVDYQSIPWAIFTDPPLARVGLSEKQARSRFGGDVLVLRQYYKTVAAAQLKDEITGIFKLVILQNGKILGAAIAGSQAGELINVIALAITQKLKVDAIANLAPVYPSLSEILPLIAAEYHQRCINSNSVFQNLLESFFNFRRS